jgi:light-regulated signal transduction histidine kinase (bacteriophytochrome)
VNDVVAAAEIVDTLHESLVVLDDTLAVVQANRAFYATFAVSAAETVGRDLIALGNAQWDIPALRALLARVIACDEAFEGYEVTHAFPGIGERTMMLNARRIATQARPTLLLAIQDITAQKAAEARLAAHARELARSNAELESLAAVASHDLQEPLRAVVGYLQLLERRTTALSRDARDLVRHAVDAAGRMQRLVGDLLAYARVGRGGAPFEAVDVNDVVRRALASLSVAVREAAAVVRCGALPTVQADPRELEAVFQNLIGNAIKFRRAPAPHVDVAAERSGAGWRFVVRDDGIGIAPGDHERIFTPFERLHTRREFPGSGIGLALVKRIVERHGGEVSVASEPGRGSAFSFFLPDDPKGRAT